MLRFGACGSRRGRFAIIRCWSVLCLSYLGYTNKEQLDDLQVGNPFRNRMWNLSHAPNRLMTKFRRDGHVIMVIPAPSSKFDTIFYVRGIFRVENVRTTYTVGRYGSGTGSNKVDNQRGCRNEVGQQRRRTL